MAAKRRGRDQRQRADEVGARRVAGAARGDGQLRERRAQDAEPGGKPTAPGEREVRPEVRAIDQRDQGGRHQGEARDQRDRPARHGPQRPVPRYCPAIPVAIACRKRGRTSEAAARPTICAGRSASCSATP
jgi:hypothetical protein